MKNSPATYVALALAPLLAVSCDNASQKKNIDTIRANVKAQIYKDPDSQSDTAGFHIFGPSIVIDELRPEFDQHTEEWAKAHNATLLYQMEGGDTGQWDVNKRYQLPQAKEE